MRLHILSDLHQEFAPFKPSAVEADVLILAGDIDRGMRGLLWAQSAFAGLPVIYVPGNHEYYGNALPKLTDKLRHRAAGSNVHVLDTDCFGLGEIVFLGCTLWTDFNLSGEARFAGFEAKERMNDYRRIRVSPGYRKLRSADTALRHHYARDWLEQELKKHLDKKVVVVTHHAPSALSLPPDFRNDTLAAAYASHLDDFVRDSPVRLWIHGHIHRSSDYMIGSTRILANPRAYPDSPNDEFQPQLVVEV